LFVQSALEIAESILGHELIMSERIRTRWTGIGTLNLQIHRVEGDNEHGLMPGEPFCNIVECLLAISHFNPISYAVLAILQSEKYTLQASR